MKKAIGLIMAVIMAAMLAACGNKVEKADSSVGAPETKSMFVQVVQNNELAKEQKTA